MKTKLEKLPKSRVRITIEVPQQKTAKVFKETYQRLAETVEIKGFRPGRAPKAITIEAIGYGRYQQETLNTLVPETYLSAIRELKVNPVEQPSVAVQDFSEEKGLIYQAEVDILPEVKLGDYRKIKIKNKADDNTASEEEIDKVIKSLQYQEAGFEDKDTPAQKGDRVEIDFDGFIDGVKQDNLCSKNHPLILGAGALIVGFEKKLEGSKINETKEFDLEIPLVEDPKNQKKARFKVKILKVQKVILPILDNHFAKKFGHGDVGELQKAIAKDIVQKKQEQAKRMIENEVIEKVVNEAQLEMPESLVVQEVNRQLVDMQNRFGPNFDKFLEKLKKNIDDIRKEMVPAAEKNIKISLVLAEIARQEGLLTPESIKNPADRQKITRQAVEKIVKMAME